MSVARFQTVTITPHYAGVRLTESRAATTLPSGKPTTDDMIEMIEHFARLGLIHRKPAAFSLPNGDLVIHPDLAKKLRERIAADMGRMAEQAFYGAIR